MSSCFSSSDACVSARSERVAGYFSPASDTFHSPNLTEDKKSVKMCCRKTSPVRKMLALYVFANHQYVASLCSICIIFTFPMYMNRVCHKKVEEMVDGVMPR